MGEQDKLEPIFSEPSTLNRGSADCAYYHDNLLQSILVCASCHSWRFAPGRAVSERINSELAVPNNLALACCRFPQAAFHEREYTTVTRTYSRRSSGKVMLYLPRRGTLS